MERIPVYVYASDPISQAGVASGLRPRPELLVVGDSELGSARVATAAGFPDHGWKIIGMAG